jgi:gliding motility-associated-like protein
MGNGQTITGCGTFNYEYTMPGCYSVTLTTSLNNGCISSFTLDSVVCVQAGPTADFTVNQSADVYYSGNVLFSNGSINADFYSWSFGDNSPLSNEVSPLHTFGSMATNTYEVILVAQDSLGCSDTATVIFTIEEDFVVYVPNSITIDGNNLNESFLPVFSDNSQVKTYRLVIYNRWGELIWQTTDKSAAWDAIYDGKICQDGVYTWKLTYTRENNYTQILVGHVNLIR